MVGEAVVAEVVGGLLVEFFVSEQVHLGPVVGPPGAGAAGEGPTCHGVQDLLDFPQAGAG